MMKIIVSGSSGFIGFHLIKELLKVGHEVIGFDNHNDYYNPDLKLKRLSLLASKNFTFYEVDINNISINDQDFDLAINLAAQPGVRVPEEKEYLYKTTNIKGFNSFCNYCIKKNIKRIIYASSSSVYSDTQERKFHEEDSILEPKSNYGKSKILNELHASKIAKLSDMSMVGLRFFSVYGPFGRPDMAYYAFTQAIKDKRFVMLNNHGNMYRDMTYIDDIIQGILGAIDYALNPKNTNKNEIFNLGNDTPIKTSFMLDKIEKFIGKKALIQHCESKNENLKTHANITKAKNLLGYMPKVTFDDGIGRFLDWHKHYENI